MLNGVSFTIIAASLSDTLFFERLIKSERKVPEANNTQSCTLFRDLPTTVLLCPSVRSAPLATVPHSSNVLVEIVEGVLKVSYPSDHTGVDHLVMAVVGKATDELEHCE